MLSSRLHPYAPFLLCAAALGGCHSPAEAPAPQPQVSGDTLTLPQPMVEAGHIGVTRVGESTPAALDLPGRLVWDEDHTARVYSAYAGRITAILVKAGDRVAAGQALAELSAPDLGSAQADARKADAALVLARKALQRQQDLIEHQVAAQKDLEQASADEAAAEAEAERAHARLLQSGGGAGVDQALSLRSPIAGVVVERNLNPGRELTTDQSGPPLFTISEPSALWVQLDASERDLPALKPGQAIQLRVTQYQDESFPATLDMVADAVDPVSRTVRVRGHVANPGNRLKAEMYITARIALPQQQRPAVPATAVFLAGERRYVFVALGGGRYQRRAIEAAEQSGGEVLVKDGLASGENVVTEGTLYLQQQLASASN